MKKYIWISNPQKSDEFYRNLCKKLVVAKFTGVLVSGDPNPDFYQLVKDFGLEVHIWFITVLNNDSKLMKDHPDWFIVNANGDSCIDKPAYVGYYRWLCLSNDNVIEYLKTKITELCKFDVDGIHLDYIRYPDVILPKNLQPKYDLVQTDVQPEFDYCYCDTCKTKFGKSKNSTTNNNELAGNNNWLNFRFQNVTNFVKIAKDIVHSHNKKISAAVFPTPENARNCVRQDWDKWNLDAYFPMLYHNFYDEKISWISECVKTDISQNPNSEIFAGLFLADFSEQELDETIKNIKHINGAGISIFEHNMLTDKHLGIIGKH